MRSDPAANEVTRDPHSGGGTQDVKIAARGQDVLETGGGGLGSEAFSCDAGTGTVPACGAEGRIVREGIEIVLGGKAAEHAADAFAKELDHRIGYVGGIAGIVESPREVGTEAEAMIGFAEGERTRMGCVLSSVRLDVKERVEGRAKDFGCRLEEVGLCQNGLSYVEISLGRGSKGPILKHPKKLCQYRARHDKSR